MGDHDHDLGLGLQAGFGGVSSVTKKPFEEMDLLGHMEGTNFQNSGVDVTLTVCVSNSALGIKKCKFCSDTSKLLWRNGPDGPKTLCNACGLRHRREMGKINTDLTLGRTPPSKGASGSAGAAVARKWQKKK